MKHFVARGTLPFALVCMLNASCSSTNRQPQPGPQAPASPGTAGPVTGQKSAIDIFIEVALEAPTADLTARSQALVLAALDAAAAAKGDVHIAVMSGPKSRGNSAFPPPPASFIAANYKTIDFELTPKDTLLASMAAVCPKADSNFPDPHSAEGAHPTACKKDVSTLGSTPDDLAHAWLWSLDPIKGSLDSFFRKNAERVQIIISNGDAAFLDGNGFSTLASAQTSAKVSIIALAPVDAAKAAECWGGVANAAPRLRGVVQGTNGSMIELCGVSAESLNQELTKAVKALLP